MINTNRRRVMGAESFPPNAIITKRSNPQVLAVCYAQGWCANERYMTLEEAQAVTDIGTVFRTNKQITHFDELKYFGIASLVQYSFQSATNLESIEVPDNLTTIGAGSFFNCNKLKSFHIKPSVTSIGSNVFGSSANIITVTIDTNISGIGNSLNYRSGIKFASNVFSVTDGCLYDDANHVLMVVEPSSSASQFPQGITTIDEYAFYFNKQVVSFTIPSGVTSIGAYAFRNSSFTSISIPDSVTAIGNGCFYNNTHLLSVNIPAITNTPTSIFVSCTGLQSIHTNSSLAINNQGTNYYNTTLTSDVYTVVNNNTLINGTTLFAVARGITGTYTIPNNITTIGGFCFTGCKASEIVFPSSVTTLNNNSFLQCGTETITLGSGVTRIGYQSFCNSSTLKTLNISASVTTIDQWGIYGLNNLEALTVDANNTVFDSRNNCNAIVKTATNELIYGSLNAVIPNDVVKLGTGAFRGLNITTMDVPASVTSLSGNVFYQNNKLTSITFRSLTPPTLSSSSIANTTTLTAIYVPAESVETYKAAQYWSVLASKIQAIPTT